MYREIGFWRFALGVGIVSIPVLILQREEPRWAWAYVGLLLLTFVVFNTQPLQRAASYFTAELRGGG
jgi:hypothetical protein